MHVAIPLGDREARRLLRLLVNYPGAVFITNTYALGMARATQEGVLVARPTERPFLLLHCFLCADTPGIRVEYVPDDGLGCGCRADKETRLTLTAKVEPGGGSLFQRNPISPDDGRSANDLSLIINLEA